MKEIQVWVLRPCEFTFSFFHCSVQSADLRKLGTEKPTLSVRNLETGGFWLQNYCSLISPLRAIVILAQDSQACVGIVSLLPCRAAEGLGT